MQTITINKSLFSKLMIGLLILSVLLIILIMPINSSLRTYILFSGVGILLLGLFDINMKVKVTGIVVFFIKSIVVYTLYINDSMLTFPDSINYVNNLNRMIAIGDYNFDTVASIAGSMHVGFYYFYLLIYGTFPIELSIYLTNTILTTVAGILFYQVFLERFSEKVAFYTLLFFLFSSNAFLFGSTILKDPLVIFLTALSMYLYVKKRKVLVALLIALFLVTVRIYSGFSIILAIIFDLLILSNLSTKRKSVLILTLFSVSFLLLNSSIVQRYLMTAEGFVSSVSVFSALKVIPITIFKFTFAPLPWNIINSKDIYFWLILDSSVLLILSIGLLLFTFKWFKYKEMRTSYYIFLIPIIVHATALGIQYGGDSTRQRSGIFVFIVLTIMIGLFYSKNRRTE